MISRPKYLSNHRCFLYDYRNIMLDIVHFLTYSTFHTHDMPETGPGSLFIRIVLQKLFWRPCRQDATEVSQIDV
jgi:hypothetical protein